MLPIDPKRIPGRWKDGFALDLHTLSSIYIGDDEYGHAKFSTERSEIGERLYRLKSKQDRSVLPDLVEAASVFIRSWKSGIDLIVPVPPSRIRAFQPVMLIAEAIAAELDVQLGRNAVEKTKDTPELKNEFDYDKRTELLEDAFAVKSEQVAGKRILLIDDLFRSGATMNAITRALYDQGRAQEVFALAMSKTRVKT